MLMHARHSPNDLFFFENKWFGRSVSRLPPPEVAGAKKVVLISSSKTLVTIAASP